MVIATPILSAGEAGGRIVLAASGSHGDVHPFIALGRALKRRGYDPVIATRTAFRTKVLAEGLDFHPVRPDVAELEAKLGIDLDGIGRALSNRKTGLQFMLREIALGFLKESFDDMAPLVEEADLVVAQTSAYGARLASEFYGVPWLSAVLQPFSLLSAIERPVTGVAPAVDLLRPLMPSAVYRMGFAMMRERSEPWVEPFREMRRSLGLPDDPANPLFEGQFSKLGTLALYSPLMGPVRKDFPEGTRITGFCAYDSEHGGESAMPAALERFLAQGAPPVVFTLGTAAVLDAGDFFHIARDACAKIGVRAVILTGYDPRMTPGDLPDSMIALPYAPFSQLFPRARVIVHQAGIGTAGEALRAGRPQLCVPFLIDQPDNAARVARLGVGRVAPRKRCDVNRLAKELTALLEKPAYARRAEEIGVLARAERGTETTVDAIAEFVEPAFEARRKASV